MKYKDQAGVKNGSYVGIKQGTPLGDALAPDATGYEHITETDHFGTIMQDSEDSAFPTPLLLSLAITTPADKLTYTVGDPLDLTGLVVTGSYSGGTTAVVPITAANVTGFDSSGAEDPQTLTITVDDVTITFDIAVEVA